jgi:type I site-specific restriction endonuclease
MRPNFKIAVVEAKSVYKTPGGGMQQAIDYARIGYSWYWLAD